jgi:hypothetical protein
MEGTPITIDDIVILIDDLVSLLSTIAAVAVVGFIIYAGLKMAMAKGDPKKFEEGKQMLKMAIIGGVVIFGVGVIVSTIAGFAQNPTQILR